MKKVIAVMLAVLMLFSLMSVAVFAEGGDDTVVTYLIVFKDYDGTTLDTQTVEEGKFPRQPAVPTRAAEGDTTYTFTGWKSSIDEVVYKAAATVPAATADTTYTATYQAKTPSDDENTTILGFLASVFSRTNRIFEQITKFFEMLKRELDKIF